MVIQNTGQIWKTSNSKTNESDSICKESLEMSGGVFPKIPKSNSRGMSF